MYTDLSLDFLASGRRPVGACLELELMLPVRGDEEVPRPPEVLDGVTVASLS